MKRVLPALAALMTVACHTTPANAPSTAQADPPAVAGDARPNLVSPQTALWTLELHPDGTLRLMDVSVKNIAFHAAAQPWMPGGRRFASAPVIPGSVGGGAPGLAIHDHTAAPSPAEGTQYSVVVVHPSHLEPFTLPLDLGAPGEGGGDVMDRWNHGSVVVRAPCWGPGSHYAVVKNSAQGTVVLTQGQVAP